MFIMHWAVNGLKMRNKHYSLYHACALFLSYTFVKKTNNARDKAQILLRMCLFLSYAQLSQMIFVRDEVTNTLHITIRI
jgi:hypothetical protein